MRQNIALAHARRASVSINRIRSLSPCPLTSLLPSDELHECGIDGHRRKIKSNSTFVRMFSGKGEIEEKAANEARSEPAEDGQDSWAFGGGEKSQGGPVSQVTQKSLQGSSRSLRKSSPLVVMGNAGKGAVANYGKRRHDALSLGSVPIQGEADISKAAEYQHQYSPSTRSQQPLAQHTYFSSPSSSFNASSFVAPGTQPPLGGTTTAGEGQGYPGSSVRRKKTALIMPGQGSQYVAMSRDLYRSFRASRTIWHQAEEALMLTPGRHMHHPQRDDRAVSPEQRNNFEMELDKSSHLDSRRGLSASGTAVARGRRGWLRDLVFSGDQLELTRAENAQPAILTCTLAFFAVLRKEFSIDLVREHVEWAAGHGSGTYASLVGSGAIDLGDAIRLLRHRGLVSSSFTSRNPILFPPGCATPASVYETWAFANAGSGKGAELIPSRAGEHRSGPPFKTLTEDSQDAGQAIGHCEREPEGVKPTSGDSGKPQRSWKRTQMSGVVVRPGRLEEALREVEKVAKDIREGRVESVAQDEVVEVANLNSQLQIVLSGSRVGVSYCCDRLRSRNLGARAVNLPVSGPYHTSLMQDASDFLRPAIENLPIRDPEGFGLVSSVDGSILKNSADIRRDLSGALAKPVQWLSSIQTLLNQGVERFICLGPGRACAHLLSKELAHRDRLKVAAGDLSPSSYEVWSLATADDIIQLGSTLSTLSASEQIPKHSLNLYDPEKYIAV
ncbi:FabD/lysophospholipase-like protein [Violaceomyces palustris]|uniref:FabD/lysophospholipase-like protein n=1 Tax=Violaceomyces palustris TaxID=1673888 RepID=A0ACD0NVN7_9BASI|nr:FabD/lysophospholipase-like protein [Violaceomyces palustris]